MWPILPILQTIFKKEIRAIVAGSDHFIRRLLHEPDIVGVLPDNGALAGFDRTASHAHCVTSRPYNGCVLVGMLGDRDGSVHGLRRSRRI